MDRLNDVQISYEGTDIPPSSRIKVKYDLNNLVRNASYTYKGETKEANYTYYDGGLPQLTIFSRFANSSYGYDSLSRVNALTVYPVNSSESWNTTYEYYDPASGKSSNLISRISHRDYYTETVYNLDYTYDKFGNITNTSNEFNSSNTSYEYDYLNQLTRDNNSKSGKTTTYNYDNGGNILSKTIYDYTTGSLDGLTGTVVQYTYGDSNWKDKLTAYNGNTITYDEIGNPLKYYNGTTFGWENGRQLTRAAKTNGSHISYRYNDSGVRIRKSVNGVATDYLVDGTKIIAEKTGNDTIWYYYDAAGCRIGFTYNGTPYYYVYNAQGDVIGLYNSGQQIVARYNYDAWGKIVSITNQQGAEITDTTHIAHINPFRYRGYYYDTEMGFYLTGTRYYDPEIGRFINADGYVSTGQGILGNNMFAYCGNNPVNRKDPSGEGWITALIIIAVVGTVAIVANAVKNTIIDKQKNINDTEKQVAKKDPIGAIQGNKAKDIANGYQKNIYPNTYQKDANQANAFKHAMWNAVMTDKIGEERAKKFANAHEQITNNPVELMEMDLHNNELGRKIALEYAGQGYDVFAQKIQDAIAGGKAYVIKWDEGN